MNRRTFMIGATMLLCQRLCRAGEVASNTPDGPRELFAQSAARIAAHEFQDDRLAYLLLDTVSGMQIGARWENARVAIPLGSLLKPFAALAYGDQNCFEFPRHLCRGTASGCWFPNGHGEVGLADAICFSCNAYFRVLTAKMNANNLWPTARQYGIELPPENISGASLMGLGDVWLVSPFNMARAYLELFRRRAHPIVREILAGMDRSARLGTGAEVDRSLGSLEALVKTGTAACTHESRAPGDGFVIAISPAAAPKILLMVRMHGMPGAHAAKIAGQMLNRMVG